MAAITGKSTLWIAVLVIAGIAAFLLHVENTSLQVTQYQITFADMPAEFDGFRIALVSDLHGNTFGHAQAVLVSEISRFEPDLIAISGDLFDERPFSGGPAFALLEGIHGLAPVYYVTGNHEIWSERFDSVQGQIEKSGVVVLRNQVQEYTRGNSKIYIGGLDDPSVFGPESPRQKQQYEQVLSRITGDMETGAFTVLLAHRPQFMDTYSSCGANLVLAGHAHGGLIRLPGIGGLIAPGQGLKPRYTSGLYTKGNTTMVVGRGLGNSGFYQIRVFNRPELVLVTLRCK
ncbi:MAG TPA: metallophosphoesterase [Firmicutes bacterium]|nr:metallophosphoesterase [Bacillota bacterium]